MCVSHVGDHITLEYLFPRSAEHITLGICVSQEWGTHNTRDICFAGGGTHNTRDMCFLVGGTHNTRDVCFPCRGSHNSRGMCFLGVGST